MSPARQGVELESVVLDEGLGWDLLAPTVSLVLEAAVPPEALQRFALGQRVDALQSGPVPAAEHEIFLRAGSQQAPSFTVRRIGQAAACRIDRRFTFCRG